MLRQKPSPAVLESAWEESAWSEMARMETYVQRVESALDAALERTTHAGPRGPEVLMEAARNLVLAGAAKRARPRLTFLFGRAVDAPGDGLVDVGAAGELIHAGSLLHDDVVDGAATRRGRPTANSLWGPTAAVLSGDLVLTLAFQQLVDRPRVITSEAVDTIAAMSRGVMAEVLARGEVSLTLGQWRAIVDGKTGSLFAWCARSAARLGDEPEAVERFGECGLRLGAAFQLADDLLDFQGGSGKDRFSDILNREPTHPILVAAERSPTVRSEMERLWKAETVTADDATRLGTAVLDTGAGEATLRLLRQELEAAIQALGPWAERPGGSEIVAWTRQLEARATASVDGAGGAPDDDAPEGGADGGEAP